MTEAQYKCISESICRRKYGKMLINMLDNLITFMIFVSYPLLGVYVFYFQRSLLIEIALVPFVSFVAVSLFRHAVNAKRPYEVYDFTPIIEKDTKRHSFPSRHIFSAFMVGMAYMQVSMQGAIDIFILGVLLSVLRVFGGVHFIRDVIFGALIGILLGYLGFYIVF
ncbi:MAG: phosphatase PAP2 family protein [Lachnospiraceae bacterium]|nr:phosphatase PAP2 family protein [Lachnospiraceae bacterium]